jgi:hypothetical protein
MPDAPPPRNRPPWLAVGLAVALAAIVGLVSLVLILVNRSPASSASASTVEVPQSATPAPAVKPQGVGATEHWTNGAGNSGTITITAAHRQAPKTAGYFPEHPAAGSWLIVNVTVHVDTGQADVNQYVFAAQGPDGVEHQGVSTPLNDMLSATVTAGRQVSGQIAFDIPAGHNFIDWVPGGGPPLATFHIDV